MLVDRPPVEQRVDQLVPGVLYRRGEPLCLLDITLRQGREHLVRRACHRHGDRGERRGGDLTCDGHTQQLPHHHFVRDTYRLCDPLEGSAHGDERSDLLLRDCCHVHRPADIVGGRQRRENLQDENFPLNGDVVDRHGPTWALGLSTSCEIAGHLHSPRHRVGTEDRLAVSTRRARQPGNGLGPTRNERGDDDGDLLPQKGYFSMSDCIVTHCRSQNVSRLTVDPKCPPDPDDFTPPNGATASSSTV